MKLNKTVAGMLLAAAAFAVPSNASAEDAWKGIANFDPAIINTAKGVNTNFEFGLTAFRQINPYVGLGFGAAIQENWKFKSGWQFPIFVTAHAEKFGEKFTPTFDFRAGYAFSTQKFDYSSFFINPMVGVRYENVGIGLGYLGSKAQFEGSKWSSAINIRLAYYFGYHSTSFSRSLTRTNFGVEATLDVAGGSDKYDYKAKTGFGINFFFLYPVWENLEMGPMVGLHHMGFSERLSFSSAARPGLPEWSDDHGSLWIPIALRTRYNARQATFAGRLYPWIRLDLGGYTSIGDEIPSGFYWSPAVGLSLDLKEGNHSLDLGIGYTSVKAYNGGEYVYNGYNNENIAGNHGVGVFQVSLGYKF